MGAAFLGLLRSPGIGGGIWRSCCWPLRRLTRASSSCSSSISVWAAPSCCCDCSRAVAADRVVVPGESGVLVGGAMVAWMGVGRVQNTQKTGGWSLGAVLIYVYTRHTKYN